VAGQAHEEAIERPVMALEEVAQPVDLAGAHGEHQFVIGSFRGFHDSHGGEVFSGWRRRVSTNIWGVGNHGHQGSFGLEVQGKPPGRTKVTQKRPRGLDRRGSTVDEDRSARRFAFAAMALDHSKPVHAEAQGRGEIQGKDCSLRLCPAPRLCANPSGPPAIYFTPATSTVAR